ncbi:Autoinducer 2 sensor kinase/phosphatase LuxQ [Planctomycetes bacterium Poly30]|uniref:histidine kinase n=1 Tax=Saltatorellus ferox TaxID=2528018 RepID=A0A518ENA1_9BACT|nr:Autoinducer 2 sensor kinase/phosphatase LuxQ [Planctomycetes bacterium Poly30]
MPAGNPPHHAHDCDSHGSTGKAPVQPASAELLSFIQELSRQETYQTVLDCTATWLELLIPCDRASLAFPVAPKGEWSIGDAKELSVTVLDGIAAIPTNWRIPIDASVAGDAFRSGQIRGSDDFSGETAVDLVKLREGGLRSSRCAPLVAGGRTIGTLNIGRKAPYAFSPADERFLQETATIVAAQCLLHQRIAEARETAAHEAENSRMVSLLQRLQLKLAHLDDEGDICSTTAHYLKRIFRSDLASLALLNADRDVVTIRALTRRKDEDPFDLVVPVPGSLFEKTIVQKRAVTWRDDAPGAAALSQHAFMGYRSGITAPLSSGSDVLGTLNLASSDVDAFDSTNTTRITELGRIVGTALASLRAHNALKEAQRDAEAASAAKGAFLANVSHELRTPLNGVLGMAQLLEGTPLDAEQLELVATIKSSGQLLMRVISDVLEVSKIESGSTVLETIPFDPVGTVAKACAMVSPAANEKGLEIAIESAPELPTMALGDPTRLQQIVVNLLSNAVKFTQKGGVYVTMRPEEADEEADEKSHRIEIAVRDTGKGIAQDAIERIFVPFQQEEASTTRRFGGTGLGLAICKQFAQLMGGGIQATSQEGEGSVFTVKIVLGRVAEASASGDGGAASSPREAVTNDDLDSSFAAATPLRILVVDDNPVNRRVAQRLLQRLGYEPELAGSGQVAIDLTAWSPYDLVFMDLSMPEIDGFEASAAIQAALDSPPTIVALTADVQESTRERCLGAGMYGLLAKPFSVATLKAQLMDVHALRKARRTAA